MSCEFTVPVSATGYARHKLRGESACRECKDAINAYHQQRQAAEPWRRREAQYWRNYRIRLATVERILVAQGGACAICHDPFKSQTGIHLDHDHSCDHEGRGWKCCADCVRGLLCVRCNSCIAILDDREWLKQAMDYLTDETTAEIIRSSRLW